MSAPVPPDQVDVATRIASTLELWAKVSGSLLILWGFIARVYKPLVLWRREHQARVIREVLAPEIAKLNGLLAHQDGCAGKMDQVLDKLRAFFDDHDMLLEIALDYTARTDETNDLLDALGFASRERRSNAERREEIRQMIDDLERRRRDRSRRITDEHSTEDADR